MFKRVLFIVPPFPGRYGLPTHPHTGIGYLCQNLSLNGIKSRVVDLRLDNNFMRIDETVNDFNPDLLGVTMMTYHHKSAYEIVDFLKKYKRKIIIGGPHVSTLKERAVEESGADFGFMGEAERSLVDFCKGVLPNKISGLIYHKDEKLLKNEISLQEDLDKIPFPKYESIDLERYTRKRIPIITSRGCPYQCIFCPIATVMGRRYRFRSPKNVFKELKYWYDRDYRDFDFQDDNFTVNKDRIFKLFDLIKSAGWKDLFMQCGNGIRADLTTKEILVRMKEVGFKSVAFGVESFDSEVLKKVRKGETKEQIEKAVKTALKVGLEVSLFFIVGLPGETFKSFKKSIKFALKYPISTATFYNLIPFPGTELFDWVKKNGHFILKPDEYLNRVAHLEFDPIFETKEFTVKERKKALLVGAKTNDLIKRKDMDRKLGGNWWSRFLAWLVYGTAFNNFLFGIIRITWVKKLVNFLLLKLKLRLNL